MNHISFQNNDYNDCCFQNYKDSILNESYICITIVSTLDIYIQLSSDRFNHLKMISMFSLTISGDYNSHSSLQNK